MSAIECVPRSGDSRLHLFWRALLRHRASIAWLAAAGIVMLAAFACTTIQVQHSVFDATALRLLVATLSSVAASNVLIAANVRQTRWHVSSWITVALGWFVCLVLT